jgi:hypothetical protein
MQLRKQTVNYPQTVNINKQREKSNDQLSEQANLQPEHTL